MKILEKITLNKLYTTLSTMKKQFKIQFEITVNSNPSGKFIYLIATDVTNAFCLAVSHIIDFTNEQGWNQAGERHPMVLLNPGSSPYFEFWFANSFDSRSDKPELKLNNKFTVSFGTKYRMEMSQTLIDNKVHYHIYNRMLFNYNLFSTFMKSK